MTEKGELSFFIFDGNVRQNSPPPPEKFPIRKKALTFIFAGCLLVALVGSGVYWLFLREEPLVIESPESPERVEVKTDLPTEAKQLEKMTAVEMVHSEVDGVVLGKYILSLSEEEARQRFNELRDAFAGRSRDAYFEEMRQFDSTEDGIVDLSRINEYNTAVYFRRKANSERLRDVFLERYDTNGDGQLTRSELAEIFDAMALRWEVDRRTSHDGIMVRAINLRFFDLDRKGFLNDSEKMLSSRMWTASFRGGDPDETIRILNRFPMRWATASE